MWLSVLLSTYCHILVGRHITAKSTSRNNHNKSLSLSLSHSLPPPSLCLCLCLCLSLSLSLSLEWPSNDSSILPFKCFLSPHYPRRETETASEHSLCLLCRLKMDSGTDSVPKRLVTWPVLASKFSVCNHKRLGKH